MERIYSSTRIQQPMRRVPGSERGAGEWEAISWEEAIEEAAKHIKDAATRMGRSRLCLMQAQANMVT